MSLEVIHNQKDPQLKERQRQDQRADSLAAKTPIDLRPMLNTNKRHRRARLNGEIQEGGKVLINENVTSVIGEGSSSVGCWMRG